MAGTEALPTTSELITYLILLKSVGVYSSFPDIRIYSPKQNFQDRVRIYKEVLCKDRWDQETLVMGCLLRLRSVMCQ